MRRPTGAVTLSLDLPANVWVVADDVTRVPEELVENAISHNGEPSPTRHSYGAEIERHGTDRGTTIELRLRPAPAEQRPPDDSA